MTMRTAVVAIVFLPTCLALRAARKNMRHPMAEGSTCAELGNHGTYFSVELKVGTPPQKFDVVADTGSDDVIIPSCICVESGSCSKEDRCFTGTNSSSTFVPPNNGSNEVPVISMAFGSGVIAAAVATDLVRVGSAQTTMDDSLLLMVERQLDIVGPFEGILGLGRPHDQQVSQQGSQDDNDPDSIQMFAKKPNSNTNKQAQNKAAGAQDDKMPPQTSPADGMEGAIPGFLQKAGITRFSICFNDGVLPGVLRLGTPEESHKMGSIGQDHWGLDFRGFSVGDVTSETLFCTEKDMKGDQETPCGMIPDTGTTVMMGPEDQLMELFGALCDAWPRCAEKLKKAPKQVPKHEAFQMELLDCESWLHEANGLDELPQIHLHLRGAGGEEQVASLSPWGYVFASEVEEAMDSMQLLGGVAPANHLQLFQGGKVCMPAFGATEYITSKNGPVWIIGTPLFYEYVVNYDLGTNPPAISLSEAACGSCEGVSEASLLVGEGTIERTSRGAFSPRHQRGKPRLPRINKHREL